MPSTQMVPTPLEVEEPVRTQRTAVGSRAPAVTVSLVLAALPVLAVWTLSHPASSLVVATAVLVAAAVFGAVRRR